MDAIAELVLVHSPHGPFGSTESTRVNGVCNVPLQCVNPSGTKGHRVDWAERERERDFQDSRGSRRNRDHREAAARARSDSKRDQAE